VTTTRHPNTRASAGTDWVRAWTQLAEIAWSAPIVIGYRTGRMLMGGWPPSARDRREYVRMWQEKAESFGRAYVAAMTTPPQETARMASAVLRPVHRRVVANRRRLSRG
jgi:hypothetical protein